MAQYTDYTEKTEPVDTDLALIYDTPAKVNKKFTFGNLWKWIAKKIVSEGISQLETTNKTIPGAINELNSKIFPSKINFETRAVVGEGLNGTKAAIVPFLRADLYNITVTINTGSVGGYIATNMYSFGFYFNEEPKANFIAVNVQAMKK